MKIVHADDRKRVPIPDAKPGQAFAYADAGNGVLTLTVVKPVQPRSITGKLVKRGNALVLDIPKGFHVDENAINQAVREERDEQEGRVIR